MRASRTLSISISPIELREAERLAKRQNRSMSELVGDALRRYRRDAAAGVAALEKVVDKLREEATGNGASGLTHAEIDAEIRAVRRARARKSRVGCIRPLRAPR